MEVKVHNYWQALARESLMDDLESQIHTLAVAMMRLAGKSMSIEEAVDRWMKRFPELVARWRAMMAELQNTSVVDFALFSVALRELTDFAQTARFCDSLEHSA